MKKFNLTREQAIKFSHAYQKLLDSHNDVVETATLLQVISVIITEWLGECWHEGFSFLCTKCGADEPLNRTFTTPDDFFACFNRLVALGRWDEFSLFAMQNWYGDAHVEYDKDTRKEFIPWLNSRTESGHFRLCTLIAEWLKEERCKQFT